MQPDKHHSVIIIGAGLSGLYAAWSLYKKKHDIIILEARPRTGGRILSPQIGIETDSRVDMGPAWVWPEFQPRLQQLLSALELETFKQYTDGDMLFEQDALTIERYNDQSAHDQSYRLVGGTQRLISSLQAQITGTEIHLNTQVTSISLPSPGAETPINIQALYNRNKCAFTADKVILALPPRIAAHSITFDPPLHADILELWKNTPTWMAAHCKIIFIYDKPFWRKQNLSGEAISRHGPLTEIYDGSPENEDYFALTSFVGLNAHQRKQISKQQLITMCMAQLQRLFGNDSNNVKDIKIKDWGQDACTTTAMDLTGTAHHPQYPVNMPRQLWSNKIILAGTEVAREHGGYLEGALESADEALSMLQTLTN